MRRLLQKHFSGSVWKVPEGDFVNELTVQWGFTTFHNLMDKLGRLDFIKSP